MRLERFQRGTIGALYHPRSTNLVNWTDIGVAAGSVSGTWSFVDTNAWRYAHRFYRTTN